MSSSVVLKAGNKSLVFGLEWFALNGMDSEQSEISNLCKEKNSKIYAKNVSDQGDVLVGFYSEQVKPKGDVYSASSAFSRMEGISEVSLFVYKVADGNVIVLASISGKPVVGFDYYGSYQEGLSLAKDFIAMRSEGVSIYGNTDELSNVENFSIDDIAKFALKEDLIVKLGLFKKSTSITVAISVAVVAAIFFGYEYYAEMKKQEMARLSQQNQPVDPNLAYSEEIKAKATVIGNTASSQWMTIANVLDNFPLEVGGWSPKNIECNLSNENADCVVTWSSIGGTFNSFKDGWVRAPENITWDASSMLIKHPYQIKLKRQPIDLTVLPKNNDINVQFNSDIQLMKVMQADGRILESAIFSVPPTVADPTTINKDILVYKGEWGFETNYWMAEYMKTMKSNFTITNLSVEYTNQVLRLKAKGEYYAKN